MRTQVEPESGQRDDEAKVLIVDDNPVNILIVRAILESLKYGIVESHSGEDAIKKIESEDFAVILLDVVMPGLNGFETARIIRSQSRRPQMPIIFLSAVDADRANLEEGYSLGAVDFLTKPFVPIALQAKVRGLVELYLEKQRATRAAQQLRLLVERATDYAIFLLDPDGNVMSWNAGAQRIKQYTADEIIGRHFSTFYPEEAIERGWPPHELKVAAAEGRFEDEGWRIRKDGSHFWANVVITALRDESGNLKGFSKITRDMTDRKTAEENARRLIEESTARRVAEETKQQIEEERERLHVTLASIGDGVIVTDLRGHVTSLNPVAEGLTGWNSKEAEGQPLDAIFRIVNEKSRIPADNPAIRALEQGMIVGLANHTVLLSKDGSEIPIDDSAAPIRNSRGESIGAVLVFRNVTERKRIEAETQKNEAIFRLVHQIGKIGHWEWNAETGQNTWSPELEALYGLKPGEFTEGFRGWTKLLHPDDVAIPQSDVRNALESGQYVNEFRVVWPDRSIHWIETRAKVFKDERGQLSRIIGVNMDITERKLQEDALKLGELRWRTMAESLPNLVWTDMPDGQADWLGSQWQRYTGFPVEELLGLQWLERVVHRDDRQRTLNVLQEACADRADYDLEHRIRRHDGHYRWFKTRGVPIRDDVGRIVSWFGTCTDIEDSKRMEESLRENDRRKDEFLATLAHELRNPLAPIRNGLQIMKLAGERPVVISDLQAMMERQLDQMIRLIDDLLDISRVSRGKLELKREPIILQDVLLQAIETSRPLIKAGGHRFSSQVPSSPFYINGDFVRLTQVFSNILNNAAKYTPNSGEIVVEIKREGDFVVTAIKDTGIGIPASMLTRVFEMFMQIDNSLEKSQGGLGIGLTLVQRLVDLHGGSVEAKSDGEGQGSTFVIKLPLIQSTQNDPDHTNDESITCRKRRVLVVDDNRDSAVSLQLMLKMMGHEARAAYDGREAIEVAAMFLPDLILMDIGMPKLNGLEATRLIRELPWGKSIKVVALTGWGQEDDRKRSQSAGCDGHLVKPVQPELLRQVLAEL